MTAIPSKSILDGSSVPTTAQFKSAMGQLHDFLSERTDVNATSSGLKVSAGKRLLGRTTSGTGSIEEIPYSDQGYNILTGGTVLGNPNKVINGAMRIDQRNEGASQTIVAGGALAFTVDRFYAYCTGANISGRRVAGPISNTYRYRFTGATGNTAVYFGTRLEAEDTASMSDKSTSLQVKLSSSSLTSVTWSIYYAATKDSFGTVASPTRTLIATGSFSITSTETTYTANVSIPTAATTGIEIVFSSGALPAGQTLTIGDIQFEEGSASVFYLSDLTTDFLKCRRFFEKSFNIGTAPSQNIGSASGALRSVQVVSASTNQIMTACVNFSVRKRVTPSIVTLYNPFAANATARNIQRAQDWGTGSASISASENNIVFNSFTTTPASSVGDDFTVHWTADSEMY